MFINFKKEFFIFVVLFLLLIFFSCTVFANDMDLNLQIRMDEDGLISIKEENQSGEAWNELIERYKGFIVGVAGVGAITMVALFIINFIKLGTVAGSHPMIRRNAIVGLICTGIATAMLGSVSLITYITYFALK